MTQSAYALRCQLLPFKRYYSNKDRLICQRKRLKNSVEVTENLSPNFTYSGANLFRRYGVEQKAGYKNIAKI